MPSAKKIRKQAVNSMAAVVACALSAVVGVAHATKDASTEEKGFSITTKVSTLGYGAEFKYKFHKKFTTRLAYTEFNYDFEETDLEDNAYDGKLNLNTLGLIADWHPFGGGFRLSAGIMSNGNEVRLGTGPIKNIRIHNSTYSGEANFLLDFKSSAPYAGFGWSSQTDGLSFDFEFGLMFHDSPMLSGTGSVTGETHPTLGISNCNFNLSTDGTVMATPTSSGYCDQMALTEDLTRRYTELQDELNYLDLGVYPVISFGLHYRF